MLGFSLALYGLAAVGAASIALSYMIGEMPKPYYREILERDGVEVTPGLLALLTSLSRVAGAGMLAVAASVFVFAAQITESSHMLVQLRPLLVGMIVLLPCVIMPKRVEEVSGIRTPWRAAVSLVALLLAAFAASIM